MKTRGVFIAFSVSLALSLLLIVSPAMAAEKTCTSCATCNNQLQIAASGDTVIILNDISAGVDGNCIIHDGNDSVILDCNNKVITGQGSGLGYGSGIAANKVLDIRKCVVTAFWRGIHLNKSSGNLVTDSNVSYNYNGIRLRNGSNEIRNTIITHNTNGISIATTSTGNLIYNNYIDNTNNTVFGYPPQLSQWSVTKTPGTNIIGGNYMGGNYWSDYTLTNDDNDDGIGDTPHTLNVSGTTTNQDSLPLVYDTFPPIVSYVSPTPPDGGNVYSSTITLNVSANENIGQCTFRIENVDYPGTISGKSCTRQFTASASGLYHYNATIRDTDGNLNQSLVDTVREVTFDLNPLSLSFVSPTPQNNNFTKTASYTINASAGVTLASCILSWNGSNESVTPTGSYCTRTKSGLTDGPYVFRMYATDYNERNASTASRTATVDTILNIAYDPATPVNDSVTGNDWVYVKVNSDIPLSKCNLSLDGVNQSMTISGTSCFMNRTGLEDNTPYAFKVYVTDLIGKQNSTKTRTLRVDTTGPFISVHTVTPVQVAVGGNITMNISASDDDGMDSVWVIVTKPDDSTERVGMVNGVAKNYTVASAGDYTITFYANDTAGSMSSVSHAIKANPIVHFSSTIGFGNETSSVSMRFYLPGTSTLTNSYTASNGIFTDKDIVDGVYDIQFQTFGDTLLIKLNGVDIGSNNGKTMKLDHVTPAASGFAYTYAVENPYTISSAAIRIYYDEDDDLFVSEEGLETFKCAQWNFTGRACSGSWSKINYTLSTSGDYIEAVVSSFSGFSVKQGPFCGDGVCDSDETPTSCSNDCTCTPGDTRLCRVSHSGICAEGTEVCTSNGDWSGCPSPGTETCNGIDDNCDGITDNVGGKTSILATKCGCYGGEYATPETCNGIDDDCDGKIDDGADCCTSGDKKQCGTSSTLGICEPGTATCVNGIWGTCVGAVTPMSETCGNNLDDDCDGEIDNGCAAYSSCAEGRVSSTCICGGDVTDSGYCCGGETYVDGCPSSGWWVLVMIGVAVLIILYVLVTYFKSHGRELTWGSLMGKYGTEEKKEPEYGDKLSSEEEMEKFKPGKEDLKEQPDVFDELKKKKK